MLMRWVKSLGKRALLLVAALLVLLIALRAWDVYHGPDLRAWHTKVPPELDAAALDATDWAGFIAAEARAFDFVREKVSDRLPPEDRSPANRYDPASPLHPAAFAQDWNRSYVLEPKGPLRGAVVLVHGLTDAPFNMRHLAALYAEAGFIAIAPRMPGHGTVRRAWPMLPGRIGRRPHALPCAKRAAGRRGCRCIWWAIRMVGRLCCAMPLKQPRMVPLVCRTSLYCSPPWLG